jgi:hypothetical protein
MLRAIFGATLLLIVVSPSFAGKKTAAACTPADCNNGYDNCAHACFNKPDQAGCQSMCAQQEQACYKRCGG